VTLDNLGGATQSGLSVESKVYNLSGTVLDDQTASGINLSSPAGQEQGAHPEGPGERDEQVLGEHLLRRADPAPERERRGPQRLLGSRRTRTR
jgi:hypothetical protein